MGIMKHEGEETRAWRAHGSKTTQAPWRSLRTCLDRTGCLQDGIESGSHGGAGTPGAMAEQVLGIPWWSRGSGGHDGAGAPGAMAGQPPWPWPSGRPLWLDPYRPPKKIPWGKLGAYRPGWVLEGALEEQALEPSLGWIRGLEPSLGWTRGLEPSLGLTGGAESLSRLDVGTGALSGLDVGTGALSRLCSGNRAIS